MCVVFVEDERGIVYVGSSATHGDTEEKRTNLNGSTCWRCAETMRRRGECVEGVRWGGSSGSLGDRDDEESEDEEDEDFGWNVG